MSAKNLDVLLCQSDLVWENKTANLLHIEQQLKNIKGKIVFLPEMFNTGFSMLPESFAENMEGETVQWMKKISAQQSCILCGSLMVEEEGAYYNRLIWMQPDGRFYHYDKRHLFAFAKEDEHFNAGQHKLIVQVNGWKICLMVCYDLRFPVWSRQTNELYDVLVYVANWPERRQQAWDTLLRARAIENQCFVLGVNRIGTDGHGIVHKGNSAIIHPSGTLIQQLSEKEGLLSATLSKSELTDFRVQFPFLDDADRFLLT